MTDGTGDNDNDNDARKLAFDRMKDDSCHGCKFAVRKPDDKLRAPWVRPYGCICLHRVSTDIDAAAHSLMNVKSDMSWGEWQPNKPTVDMMNCVSRLATEAADLMWDLLKYGYMEPETVCVFRHSKAEEAPK